MSIAKLLLNNKSDALNALSKEMGARAVHVIYEASKTNAVVSHSRLSEDETSSPLTRDTIKGLLSHYSRIVDPSDDAETYQSDTNQDVTPDTDGYEDEPSNDQVEFNTDGNEDNSYTTDEDDAGKHIIHLFHDAIENDYPVEFHLDDGSFVMVEPAQAQTFLDTGKADDILNYMSSVEQFQELLSSVFGNDDDGDSDD